MRGIYLLFATLMSFLLSSAQTLVAINDFSISEASPSESPSTMKPETSTTSRKDESSFTSSSVTSMITNTIAISSILSASSTSGADNLAGNGEATSTATTTALFSSSTAGSSASSGISRNTLIIILASVLGTLGIILVSIAIYLFIRYRRNRSFTGRGVTPIDDSEIESWRRSGNERKVFMGEDLVFDKETGGRDYIQSNTIQMTHSPGWTWTASPTSSRTRSTFYPSGISSYVPDSPTFLAQAPNARIGLTDEVMPGAEPFIKPAERRRSRLSKSGGHSRTKSRRSSVSGRSMWSIKSGNGGELKGLKANDRVATWYDPEDDFRIHRHYSHRDYNDSPAMSFQEMAPGPGTLAPVTALSPRPPPRVAYPSFWDSDREIGLAIS
ncbi:hypothetical protein OCU04_010092 [Sclerotinia nivalis]|uniref:Mid2 domain-containing protein n=1 Tax=Sclerotinia nivalis TaxID=352851 RepID=A0A9X0AER5_9HELO|nr:hypothetical protein OCU04_010092 [Sclerotinia nivalis]